MAGLGGRPTPRKAVSLPVGLSTQSETQQAVLSTTNSLWAVEKEMPPSCSWPQTELLENSDARSLLLTLLLCGTEVASTFPECRLFGLGLHQS